MILRNKILYNEYRKECDKFCDHTSYSEFLENEVLRLRGENKDYIPKNNRIVTRQEIISQIGKIHRVKRIDYSPDIDKSDANVLTVFLDFQEEESIKHEDLVKGEIYHTDGNYRCYPTIFRYGFNVLGKYTYINAIDFKTECPIRKATVIERVKLTKAELKNNDYWNGKELIKIEL